MGERETVDPRWRMLAVLFLARTVLGFQFQTIASTESGLRAAFGISFAEIGALIGLYMLPGILLALPGGLLIRRFGDKAVCCAGLALMGLGGVLMGLSQSYELVLTGRLISGIGGVFLSLATGWHPEGCLWTVNTGSIRSGPVLASSALTERTETLTLSRQSLRSRVRV